MIFYEDYESEDDNAELSTDINNNSRKNEEEDLNKSREAAPTSFISNKLKKNIKHEENRIGS